MKKLINLALYTLRDQMRHKSFYIFLGVSALFVLLIRGCYDLDYTLNGHKVSAAEVAWHASLIVFHLICYGMFFMAMLISMKIFSRDKNDGSTVMFLSRPVKRWQYVLGRSLGTWLLCMLFMFILHIIILIITWFKTGGIIPGFVVGSLVSSINLLFIITTVCLFSLFMPDFIAVLSCIGIIGIGFVSETGHRIMQNKVVQTMFQGNIDSDSSLWRVLFPKINMLQYYAGSVIKNEDFQAMGPVHPTVNVLMYTAVFAIVSVVVFNRKEVD